MKPTFSRCLGVILAIIAGYGSSLFSQCAIEENITSFSYMGKNYEIVREMKTWGDAAACAVERGGYLVEIGSREEQDTLYGAIIHGAGIQADYAVVTDGGGIAYVWIGASDQHSEGSWIWDGDGDNAGVNFWNGQGAAGANDGTAVEELYNNWGGSFAGPSFEPDDFGAGQDGAAIGLAKWPAGFEFTLGIASEWNDISSENTLYFVIEYDCEESYSTLEETTCGEFISPSGKIWKSSDTYLDTIPNMDGCDSVITINLTVISLDTSVVQDNNVLTANANGVEYQWLNCGMGNQEIQGETNQVLTATDNGDYAVVLKDGDCTDTSACFSVTGLQVNEKPLEETLKIYQDPSTDQLQIDLGKSYGVITIKVMDAAGRHLMNRTYNQRRLLNLDFNKPPGIYLIKITTESEDAVVKMLKQ